MKFNYASKWFTVFTLQLALSVNAFALAFIQPFESVTGASWSVENGSASVVPGQVGATGNSLELAKGTTYGTETKVVQPVTWDAQKKIAFIDVLVKPAANPNGSMASIYANGAQVAFQGGKVWARNGNDNALDGQLPDWIETSGTYTVPTGGTEASSFVRVMLREDYEHLVWDLYIDGQMVAANLDFEGRGSNLTEIEFYGSLAGNVHLDQLQADPDNMLFTDTDRDGLPDAWEAANGGTVGTYDRDVLDSNGKSLIQKYMESLWAAGSKIPNGKVADTLSASGGNRIEPLSVIDRHQMVGAVNGSLSVGGDGSAVYSVPIDLPKGTAGMEPKLALGYSSNGGNGLYGVGWSLSGLQKITRGAGSAMKDGFYHPVGFNEYDRFFLDGERLVCVDGTYGTAGSKYRTETDSFARVTLNGTGASQWWKVETKAGLIVELGHTTDSVEAMASGVLSWNVNRVSDTVGNYYKVAYTRDTVSGIDVTNLRLDRIDYTGNDAAGLGTYCTVFFDYESRDDVSRAYSAQLSHLVSKRLSRIRVVTDGSYDNHSYVLGYTNSYQTGRSFLTSVEKRARNDANLTIPATRFTYDGLTSGSPWGDAPVNNQWPVYNASWDATGNVNSMVSTGDGGTSIRLDGDVARVAQIPGGGVTLSSDSILTFKVHAESFVSGAYIGLDDNPTYSASPNRLTLIKGSGAAPAGIAKRGTIPYVEESDGWMPVSIPVGTIATGAHPYLVLINVDDNPNDGVSSIVFKDLRVYRPIDGVPASAMTFSSQWEVPHFSDVYGKDLGIRFMDLNGDGLPDMCDWRAADYGLSAGVLKPNTVGQVYRNTGSGFVLDTTLRPLVDLPLSSRKDDLESYNYNRKHHLFAQQMDINGDGKPDFLGSTSIKYVSGSLSNDLTFWTNLNGAWQELPAYKLPFRVKNIGSTAPYGGTPRDQHCEWVDIDSDGYTDLVFYTTTQGKLVDPSNENATAEDPNNPYRLPVVGDRTTCWLNKVHLGKGWVRADNLGLPEMLQRTYPAENQLGRRLLDITGDGRPEIVEALSMTPEQRYTYKMAFAANGEALGWETVKDAGQAAPSPWDLPKAAGTYNNAALANVSGDPIGGEMMDLNGDGLPDYVRKIQINGVIAGCVYMNRGGASSPIWNLEPGASSATAQRSTFDVPRPLYFALNNAYNQTGYEVADLNGDGLPDILVSQNTGDDNFVYGGTNNSNHNVALLNTGNGWDGRTLWGLPSGNRIYNTSGDSQNSKRRSRLQDLNGDGFPDLITGLVDQSPQVWINQCKPEVLIAVKDGFDSTLKVEYRRLNDPTPMAGDSAGRAVYTANEGGMLAGQIAVRDTRLVVSRLKEPDGQNGWRCTRRHYGDLRFDRLNEASIGFNWVEVHNELMDANGVIVEKGYTKTTSSSIYPNAGRPVKTETYVNVILDQGMQDPHLPGVTAGFKLVAEDTSTYGELPYVEGAGGWVRRPVQLESWEKKFDLADSANPISVAHTVQNYQEDALPPITWVWNESRKKMVPSGTPDASWNNLNVYGFAKNTLVTALDGSSVYTENTYYPPDLTNWYLGRLSKATVTKTPVGGGPSVKTSQFEYSSATGLITSETVEATGVTTVKTTYDSRDACGNVISTTVTAGQARTKTTTYDGRHRFVVSETDPMGNTLSYGYDYSAALRTSSTDFGGLETRYEYDAFGTKLVTRNPDGTAAAEITRYATNAELPAQVLGKLNKSESDDGAPEDGSNYTEIHWARSAQASGTPWATAYFDVLGREVVTEKTAMTSVNGYGEPSFQRQFTITKYDNRGRKLRVSDPFLLGDAVLWTTFTYDAIDRVMETKHPDGTLDGITLIQKVTLDGQPCLHSIVHNRKNNLVERWDDQHSRLIQSSDPSGQTTRFDHDAENRVISVKVGGVEVVATSYDALGRKTYEWDIDAGASWSSFNGFGQVTSVTNGRGDTTSSELDACGRVTKLTTPEGIWNRSYLASGPARGKIWKITGPAGYLEETTYDSLGRPTLLAKTQFGETTVTKTCYNALGEMKETTDAGGVTTCNRYDPVFGSFKTGVILRSASTGPIGTLLWAFGSQVQHQQGSGANSVVTFESTEVLSGMVTRVTTTNARTGHTTAIQSTHTKGGNKLLQNLEYQWDANGNLTSRNDKLINKTEIFTYDTLDRLTSSTVGGESSVPYTYDVKGNLTGKGADTLTYGGSRPHAVSSAKIKNPGSGDNRAYSYDADGNATSDGLRTFGWASFGQLSWVMQTSCPLLKTFTGTGLYDASVPGHEDTNKIVGIDAAVQYLPSSATGTFSFDAAGARAKQEVTRTFVDTSTATTTKLYFGAYEREIHSSKPAGGTEIVTQTLHRHSFGGAVYTVDDTAGAPGGPSATLSIILTDPLGSTDVVLVSTWVQNSWSIGKAERQSFNAWGERRDASSWGPLRTASSDDYQTSATSYRRGYTGHEMLDDFGLVHMNGRIYDAEIGRFLSPDPYVQVPEWSQNFNRYSYVLNNPLSKTDPTGHKISGIGALIATVVISIIAFYAVAFCFTWAAGLAFDLAHPLLAFATLGKATVCAIAGAISSAGNCAVNGGSGNDMAKGILVGAISGAICGGILGPLDHGEGWATNFVKNHAEAAVVLHTAGHGVVGGASNAAMGGKFQDGFISGMAGAVADRIGEKFGMDKLGEGGPAGKAIRTAFAGVVGGTASAIGGGKFANGAFTAAFQHLFNEETADQSDSSDPWGLKAAGKAQLGHLDAACAFISDGVINFGASTMKGGMWLGDQARYIAGGQFSMLGTSAVDMDMSPPNPYGKAGHYNYKSPASDLRDSAILAWSLCEGNASVLCKAPAATPKIVIVTSWASKGVVPDLAAGRWVMVGGPTRWNFIKTGLWGPKVTVAPLTYERAAVPLANSITEAVPASRLAWPPGWEKFKGALGQRVLK
ncbi:RHS repeat-associated core domain-containing protein [Luteolibacter sp. LG18]|uniref:RHS repeat-associated core domain-containing protein n=1 Tax=Luteolibacter sp. LG18 TaxID=2819286 RepID=UPI002B2CDAA6|nr:hypothetical protein llg_15830 [Luteolibacter sp. LG18]